MRAIFHSFGLAVVVAAAVGLGLALSSAGPTQAQDGGPAAPANVRAVNGANPGQVMVSWEAVAAATFYRIGWVAFDDIAAVRADGREWLDAFDFKDVANRGQTTQLLKGLTPDTSYAFIAASGDRRFGSAWRWSDWTYLTTTAASCPTATPGQHPTSSDFCAITGLPLGDGYVEIGEQHSWAGVKLTITRAVIQPAGAYTPLNVGGSEAQQLPNRPGRRYLRLYVTLENDSQFAEVSFQPGSSYTVDTDAGTAFERHGWRDIRNDGRPWHTDFLWEIPERASIAVLAARPLYSVNSADFNTPKLFRIPIPAQ